MADITAVVTDTHPLLLHMSRSKQLGPKARALFDAAEKGRALIYVPAIVIVETGLLARAVRVNLHRPVRQFFSDVFSNPAFQTHALDALQAFDGEELRFTRDHFDILVVAAARDLDLPLITRDAAIVESGLVRTIW